ncbi:hypothetical protein L596_030067 [Steinernema carpocapsae]|uniref:Uncharacterized protein n=1 Tax=Steinernema carpocapsae TaxID=34508 RepID=A0A4U5LRM3_STECR|nr:hypothetical protein L596_030067 [Steinernema carpocapsae]
MINSRRRAENPSKMPKQDFDTIDYVGPVIVAAVFAVIVFAISFFVINFMCILKHDDDTVFEKSRRTD